MVLLQEPSAEEAAGGLAATDYDNDPGLCRVSQGLIIAAARC
jgi:hypothetical protein